MLSNARPHITPPKGVTQEELNAALGNSASPGFEYTRPNTFGAGIYLYSGMVPSNVSGKISLVNGDIVGIAFTTGSASTFDIVVERRNGLSFTTLVTFSITALRKDFLILPTPVAVLQGDELCMKCGSGTVNDGIVAQIIITGTTA